MKRLLVILLGLILAGVAALYFLRDPGTADITLLGWQLHTTALGFIALVLGLMIALAVVWRLLGALLRLPAFFRALSARVRQKQADDALLRAFAESARGRFEVAETLAMQHVDRSSVGAMHFVIAADAALARGDTAAALARLDQTRTAYPRFADYLALHIAKQLSTSGHHATAMELLQRLHSTHDRDEAVLLALAEALYRGEDWQKLHALMPAIRRLKTHQLSEQTLWQWERGQILGRLRAVVRGGSMDALRAIAAEIPKKLKTDAGVMQAQADAAVALGHPEEARHLLERALDQAPTAALLRQWLKLPNTDPAAASALVQRLQTQHPSAIDDNTRAQAWAMIALQREDFTAAEEALAPALQQGTDPAAFALAAELAERQRDSARAAAHYAKALALQRATQSTCP